MPRRGRDRNHLARLIGRQQFARQSFNIVVRHSYVRLSTPMSVEPTAALKLVFTEPGLRPVSYHRWFFSVPGVEQPKSAA